MGDTRHTPAPWTMTRIEHPPDTGEYRQKTQECYVLHGPAHPSAWVADVFVEVGRPDLEYLRPTLSYDEAETILEPPGRGAANAARIVACVNACAGINPEAVPMLVEACRHAEDLLAFHEGSEKPDHPGGKPVVWINAQGEDGDLQTALRILRAALAAAKPE